MSSHYLLIMVSINQKNLNQNSQAVKKECGPQKGQDVKRCEIQGGGQEMAVMGKTFNYDNSGKFALPPPLGFGTKFT